MYKGPHVNKTTVNSTSKRHFFWFKKERTGREKLYSTSLNSPELYFNPHNGQFKAEERNRGVEIEKERERLGQGRWDENQ